MRPGVAESRTPRDRAIDAVIFDLDGTLVDSPPAAIEATIQALSRFEVHVTAAEVREQFGGGSRKLVGYFLERALGLEEAGQAIDEATQLMIDLQVGFTDRVELLPEARQLLSLLKDSGYRLALATMAARSLAGMPLAGFRATPDRRIIVLCGMVVSVIRFKNPLLHRQSSLRKRRLGENRGFRPSF